MGARCIDCPARGGLGFIPMEHCHAFTALGIQMERTEREGGPKPDSCYAARLSVLDSDSDTDPVDNGAVGPQGSEPRPAPAAPAAVAAASAPEVNEPLEEPPTGQQTGEPAGDPKTERCLRLLKRMYRKYNPANLEKFDQLKAKYRGAEV